VCSSFRSYLKTAVITKIIEKIPVTISGLIMLTFLGKKSYFYEPVYMLYNILGWQQSNFGFVVWNKTHFF